MQPRELSCALSATAHVLRGGAAPPAQRDALAAELVPAVLRAAVLRLADCSARDLSMLTWALGALGSAHACDRATLTCLTRALLGKHAELDPHGLSNVLWGLATLRAPVAAKCLTRLLASGAASLAADKWAPQALANVAWALAKLGHCPDDAWCEVRAAGLRHAQHTALMACSVICGLMVL
jgi:hypothetical protein